MLRVWGMWERRGLHSGSGTVMYVTFIILPGHAPRQLSHRKILAPSRLCCFTAFVYLHCKQSQSFLLASPDRYYTSNTGHSTEDLQSAATHYHSGRYPLLLRPGIPPAYSVPPSCTFKP